MILIIQNIAFVYVDECGFVYNTTGSTYVNFIISSPLICLSNMTSCLSILQGDHISITGLGTGPINSSSFLAFSSSFISSFTLSNFTLFSNGGTQLLNTMKNLTITNVEFIGVSQYSELVVQGPFETIIQNCIFQNFRFRYPFPQGLHLSKNQFRGGMITLIINNNNKINML